jgi:hypothetical protein
MLGLEICVLSNTSLKRIDKPISLIWLNPKFTEKTTQKQRFFSTNKLLRITFIYFQIKFKILYATSPDRLFSRNAFLIISLAPLIVIDSIALILLAIFPQAPWLGWVVVFNTAGAIGDLWMATLLLRCPSSIAVKDRKTGMAIYAPPYLNVRSLPFRKRRKRIKSQSWSLLNLVVSIVSALIVISFLLPVLFDILQVPSFAIGTDNGWIVRWENNAKGFNLSLGLFPLLAIAVVFVSLGILLKLASDRSRS